MNSRSLVALVLAGNVLSLQPGVPHMRFPRELIFTALLPPPIFEAALYIPRKEQRSDAHMILALTSVGVLPSASVTLLRFHYFVRWGWAGTMLFSVPIAEAVDRSGTETAF